jgi:CRP-like cAMP-binding protein
VSPDDRLSRAERELFVRSFARGGMNSPVVVQMLSESMSEAYYPAGSMLYQRGALPRFIYYVVTGRVSLQAEGMAPLEFGRMSSVGGLDALQDIPYSRTAVALEDTRALLLPAAKYSEVLEDHFEFARQMVSFFLAGVETLATKLPLSELYQGSGAVVPAAPPSARRLGLLDRLLVVRHAPLIGALRSQVLVALAERLEERALPTGEPLYPPDSPRRDSLWIVAAGSVRATRLRHDGARDSHEFHAGDVVLLYAAFGDLEPAYEVEVTRDARLLGLRKLDFLDLLEDHGDAARVALAHGARQRSRLQARLAELSLSPPPLSMVPRP